MECSRPKLVFFSFKLMKHNRLKVLPLPFYKTKLVSGVSFKSTTTNYCNLYVLYFYTYVLYSLSSIYNKTI